jgi:hypothetical protein
VLRGPYHESQEKNLFPLTLVLCVVATTMAWGYRPKSDEQQQVEFIANFYKNYLSQAGTRRTNNLPAGFFYSKGADAMITTNGHLCDKLSRGDEICGYGTNGDIFLNAQEIDPDLTFEKAGFQAVVAGKNTIDVSFNVYPELGEFYDRKIRYVLAKEDAGWRVDDAFFEDDGGFPVKSSMRYEINQENAAVLFRAGHIFEVARWVFTYLSHEDMLARAERFAAMPVQICSEDGSCESITMGKGDVKLRRTMEALHQAYYLGYSDNTTDLSDFLPKEEPVMEGKTVKVDALDFTFQNNAWWITKIDLGRLGMTIPVKLQREPFCLSTPDNHGFDRLGRHRAGHKLVKQFSRNFRYCRVNGPIVRFVAWYSRPFR